MSILEVKCNVSLEEIVLMDFKIVCQRFPRETVLKLFTPSRHKQLFQTVVFYILYYNNCISFYKVYAMLL